MKWISVKDKLPDKGGNYLIYCQYPVYKNSRVAMAEYCKDNQEFYDQAYDDPINGVTHWTKEPEPPEGEK